jgi:integrase
MLIKCPECELQVSDKAVSCPHCGYPLKPDIVEKVTRKPKKNKRRRLPNGFGQISEIKGHNLRKPFRAMVTVGKTQDGRPICKTLKPEAYFETYNDAYEALMEYNKNPCDLSSDITMQELYEKWYPLHVETLNSKRGGKTWEYLWGYCSEIYKMRVSDVRIRHIKHCIENASSVVRGVKKEASPNVRGRIKSLFNLLLDYAVEQEIVTENYSRKFAVSRNLRQEMKESTTSHKNFTDEEMTVLWDHVDSTKYVDLLLIQCYSGWRPQELGLIKMKDTDIENWMFSGGMKTDAGKNRVVPIHSRIRPLVQRYYEKALEYNSEYLFNVEGLADKSDVFLSYEKYKRCFHKTIDELGLKKDHRPHDGRVQFVTMAKKYGVDEYAIKYMVGHYISDLTEKVYTRRDSEWLASEIEKIK